MKAVVLLIIFLTIVMSNCKVCNSGEGYEIISPSLPSSSMLKVVKDKNNIDIDSIIVDLEEEKQKDKACAVGAFKSYTDYKVYKNKSTKQYKLQMDNETYTDDEGFRRWNEYYIVATGRYYSDSVGTKLKVEMENGEVFKVIVGDIKQNIHTDENNCYCLNNGSVLEFIVDTSKLGERARKMGDISYSRFSGNIAYISNVEK